VRTYPAPGLAASNARQSPVRIERLLSSAGNCSSAQWEPKQYPVQSSVLSTSAVVSKDVLRSIPPIPFAALRICLAAPILWAFARRFEPGVVIEPPLLRTLACYALLGVIGVWLPQALGFVGLKMVGPGAMPT
jgi:EamA-like transporter family